MTNLNTQYPYKLTDMHGARGVCVPVRAPQKRPEGVSLNTLFPPSAPRKSN